MKTFKFSAFALALVVAISSAFAFNTTPAKAGSFSKTYYYIGGDDPAEVKDPDMWIENGDPCGLAGDLPCTRFFSNDTRSVFDAHIATYNSVEEAKDDATLTRQ